MFCNKCGNELKPNAKFCNKCGNSITIRNRPPLKDVVPEEKSSPLIDDFEKTSLEHPVLEERSTPVIDDYVKEASEPDKKSSTKKSVSKKDESKLKESASWFTSWIAAFARVIGQRASTAIGRFLIYSGVFVLMLGLVCLGIAIEPIGVVIVVFGTYKGWRLITFIQPAMFVWMPLMGWVIYFIIKFILSAFIGSFILVPIDLAKRFINMCIEESEEYEEGV